MGDRANDMREIKSCLFMTWERGGGQRALRRLESSLAVVGEHRVYSLATRIPIPAPTYHRAVILGELFNLSVPPLPHLLGVEIVHLFPHERDDSTTCS